MNHALSPDEAAGDYEVVIRPNTSWLHIDWRGVVEYRDLLFLLVRREFVSKYQQTLLGPSWFIFQPLLSTFVYTVFQMIAKISTDKLPYTLFNLCGLLAWNYFAQNLLAASNTFTNNSQLFGKVYFPRIIMPLSLVISNLASLGLQFVTFLAFFLYYKFFTVAAHTFQMGFAALFVPFLILQLGLLSLGISLWMSALTSKYRDLWHLLQFITQLWMFGSAVIFPLSAVPARWQWAANFNPMVAIVEAFRYCLLGHGTVTPFSMTLSATLSLLALVTGALIFQRTERTFIDTV